MITTTFIILTLIGSAFCILSLSRSNPIAQKTIERGFVAVGFHPYLEESITSLEEIGLTRCETCHIYARPGDKCCHNPRR